jgi:hypothetical protein
MRAVGTRRFPVIFALGLVALLQSGCFSVLASGGFSDAHDPPAPVKAVALAADVVTLPVQVGAVAVWNGIDAIQSSSPKLSPPKSTPAPKPSPAPAPVNPPPGAEPTRAAGPAPAPRPLVEIIAANPAYIFDQQLDLAHDDAAIRAVKSALLRPDARFTDDQLRRLYPMLAPDNALVLVNPHCSEAFLREALAALPRELEVGDFERVRALILNPAVPKDLLEEIAADKTRFSQSAKNAELQLMIRGKSRKP